jgi:DNA polymerase-3 subunit delta'
MAETAGYPPYPWLQEIWDRLQQARSAARLPHALLFVGNRGMGKRALVEALAHSLLCESPGVDGKPCGICRSCQLFRSGNHPDFSLIAPEEEGKAIKIDRIREFTANESLTSHSGGYKVILIEPAEAMNKAAANSLLKTLEEPMASTLIILNSARPADLTATIRSRCQQLHFKPPPEEMARQWLESQSGIKHSEVLLQLACGAPLLALQYAEQDILEQRQEMLGEFAAVIEEKLDPVDIAGRWEKLDLSRSLQWISSWVIDILKLGSGADPQYLINRDQYKRLHGISVKLELKRLYRFLDLLYQVNRNIDSTLNKRLLLEELLLKLIETKQIVKGT